MYLNAIKFPCPTQNISTEFPKANLVHDEVGIAFDQKVSQNLVHDEDGITLIKKFLKWLSAEIFSEISK